MHRLTLGQQPALRIVYNIHKSFGDADSAGCLAVCTYRIDAL